METIRKKICLDDYRSHINGIFPYVFYDDDNCSIQIDNELNNYGNFVCDVVKDGSRLRYLEALRKYYQVSEIIRNALFNPQCHEGCEWTSGTTFLKENICENFYDCNVVTYDEYESGYTNIQMVVSNEEKALLDSIGEWWKNFWEQDLLNDDITDDAIRFWLEFKEFFIKSEDGNTLFRVLNAGKPQIYFDSNDNYWNTEEVVNTFDMVSPYIEIPICLNQTKTDGGLYTTYEYDLADDGSIVKSNNATDLSATTEFSGLNITVSSQLFNLISPDAIVYKDIEGNDVIGIPQPLGVEIEDGASDIEKLKGKNGKGKIYKCDYKSGTTLESGAFSVKQIGETYYYWTAIESGESITKRLSEPDVNNSNGYVEVQYVTSIPSILGIDNLEPGSYIYVKSKFDKELEIPYEVTSLDNLESGKTYNIIKSISTSNDTYLIDYAINVDGGNIENTGFHYRDVIKYKKEGKTLLVNDIYETELSAYTLTIESSTLLSGETTNVKKDSNLPILFFNPSMDGLVDPPEVKVDFSLDRGSSAAWERHFKLMECNTMEDLENYGNNYFNARQ